jgi:hypothetical protein
MLDALSSLAISRFNSIYHCTVFLLWFVNSESYLKDHELHAAFIVVKHDVVPMDLVAIDTSSGKRLYSFLSVGWGMMADVDIESDKYRQLGGSRFALMAVIKIAGY